MNKPQIIDPRRSVECDVRDSGGARAQSQFTNHVSRISQHKLRFTFHISRITRRTAFTLIELLVVIAIIAILAALLFPVTAAVNRLKIQSRCKAELGQIETWISQYKDKLGHYPPDNPGNWMTNQLFFEHSGTIFTNSVAGTVNGGGI